MLRVLLTIAQGVVNEGLNRCSDSFSLGFGYEHDHVVVAGTGSLLHVALDVLHFTLTRVQTEKCKMANVECKWTQITGKGRGLTSRHSYGDSARV